MDGVLLFEQAVSLSKPIVLGRRGPATLVIADPLVSSAHVELSSDGKWLMLRDLGSQNGTFVAGKRVKDSKLPLPCQLNLGGGVNVDVSQAVDVAEDVTQVRAAPKAVKTAMGRVAAPSLTPWLDVWVRLSALSARAIVLAALAGTVGFLGAGWILVRLPPASNLVVGVGLLVSMLVGSLMLAALLAIPGLLIRGAYDVKPMYVGLMSCIFLTMVCSELLIPLTHGGGLGILWTFIIVPLSGLAAFTFFFPLLMTTLPHKWGKALLRMSLSLSIMSAVGYLKKEHSRDRQAYMQKVFEESRSNLVAVVAGQTVSSEQVGDDLSALEKQFSAPAPSK